MDGAPRSRISTFRQWGSVLGVVLYWLMLFLATHLTPQQLQANDLRGNDFLLHSVAFYFLTLFFWLARYGTASPNLKTWRPYVIFGIFTIYALLDELTQSFVHRTVSLDDWLADVTGILTAILTLKIFRHAGWWLLLYWGGFAFVRYFPQSTLYFHIMPEHFSQYRIFYLMAVFAGLTVLFCLASPKPRCYAANRGNMWFCGVFLAVYAVLDVVICRRFANDYYPYDIIGNIAGIILGLILVKMLVPVGKNSGSSAVVKKQESHKSSFE